MHITKATGGFFVPDASAQTSPWARISTGGRNNKKVFTVRSVKLSAVIKLQVFCQDDQSQIVRCTELLIFILLCW